MKMNFKYVSMMACAALMAGFTSCSNDDAEVNAPVVEEGTKTTVGFSLAFPKSSSTRAEDENATGNEVAVKDVTVFIFNTNGSPAKGNFTELTSDDFDPNSTTNTHTLKEASKVATTVGVKRVYVGINLPDLGFTEETTEAELNNSNFATSVADLTSSTTGYVMFSKAVKVTESLVVEEDDNWATTNTIEVSVERLIAKMAADGAPTTEFDEGEFSAVKFGLGQAGKEYTYLAIHRDLNGKLITPENNVGAAPAYADLKDLNTTGSLSTYESFYGIEHASAGLIREEVTYAIFCSTFKPEKMTVKEGDIWKLTEWIEGSENDGTFWLLTVGTDNFYFNEEATAKAYMADKNIVSDEWPSIYRKGHNYYYQFLGYNLAEAGKEVYEFARNQYYHLTVTTIKGLGQPGEPENGEPEKPERPKEPVVTTPTNLMVNIDIQPWAVKAIGGIVLE